MFYFNKYPKSYFYGLSTEERKIKAVLGDDIGMRFRYKKTCGLFDLTYTVDDKYIVKFENEKTKRSDLRRMAALTALLHNEPRITFEVPNMYAAEYEFEPGCEVFAVRYEKIHGDVLSYYQMDTYRCMGKEQRRAWDITMRQIGTFMAELHSIPVMDVAHLFPNSVPAQIQQAVQSILPELANEEKSFRRRVLENVLTAAYPDYDEVLCHNDLNPWNIALNKDHTIAGIFDWGLSNINRPIREKKYWEYGNEHEKIITETYCQNRGIPFDVPEKERVIRSNMPFPAMVLSIHERLCKER